MTDPDRLREALEQYDEGIAGTHQVSELAAAARQFLRILEADDQLVEEVAEAWSREFFDRMLAGTWETVDNLKLDAARAVLARLGGNDE